MNAVSDYPIFQFALWRSLSVARTQQGYAVFEAPDRFWRERLAEAVLRLVGVGLILFGNLQWHVPYTMPHSNLVPAHVSLPGLFICTGVVLYFFASRGFRNELHFETLTRQISIGRLNTKDCCLISRQIPMDRIESLFVERATPRKPLASLHLRLKGFRRTVCVMRGSQSEIEELHRQLCRDIRIVQSAAAKTGSRSRLRPTMYPKSTPAKPASAFRVERGEKPALAFGGRQPGR